MFTFFVFNVLICNVLAGDRFAGTKARLIPSKAKLSEGKQACF